MSVLIAAGPLAGHEPTDSAAVRACGHTTGHFRWQQIILPASLVAVGGFGVGNGWFKALNRDVRDGMADLRRERYFHADDWIQYLPVAGYAGLGLIPGVQHHHNLTERLCAGTTAYAVMALITNTTKLAVREPRPDTGARNSFPSGHSATAFTGAELMRLEYGNLIGAGGYAVATAVAFLRLYNNRHWLNDIIAGAGIGILSARIGYWLLPLERRLFRLKGKEDIVVVPYTAGSGSYGLSLAACF